VICYLCGQEIKKGQKGHYGLHSSCFCKWFRVDVPYEFRDIARMQAGSENSGEDSTDGNNIVSSFFLGKFRKYAASLDGVPYILKVEEDEYPELPVVEFLCNQIASELGMNVPEFHLIDYYGSSALAVKNFIRPGKMETLHHIYHFLDGRSFDCETLIRIIGDRTGRLYEIERFVFLCLFDSLTGNHDRHGRNIALIEEAGQYRLAPFYDNPSYIGMEDTAFLRADHSPRGRIATGTSSEHVMTDYIEEFIRLGYQSVVEEFRSKVVFEKIKNLTGWKFLSDDRESAFERLIEKRIRQLQYEK
jgi:hypothetical protein